MSRSKSLSSVRDMQRNGLVRTQDSASLAAVAERYAVALTPTLQAQINPACDNDPIARQFVPSAEELLGDERELPDPIGDDAHSPLPGIVHRYPDRLLLMPNSVCAVYCRYCFRRDTVGHRPLLTATELDACFNYIQSKPAVWEVILSGGDPLVLSDRRLAGIMSRLASIVHVKILRIHTRMITAQPGRLSTQLIEQLRTCGKTVYLVMHVNHARELSESALAACKQLIDAGVVLLAQTVLLRGVNDDAQTLETLFRTLVMHRIRPYYLHHCDLAEGTGHFRTSIETGQAIAGELRQRMSGIAQPNYMLDIPGGYGKVPIQSSYIARDDQDEYVVTDPKGQTHRYPGD